MNIKKNILFYSIILLILFSIRGIMANEAKDLIHLQLKDGLVVIETRPDLAPKHVEQIKNWLFALFGFCALAIDTAPLL